MPILKIFADTKGFDTCRSCDAPIEWAQLASGQQKRMPFDPPIVAVRTVMIDGRVVEEVDTAITSSHFQTCPQAPDWRKPKR